MIAQNMLDYAHIQMYLQNIINLFVSAQPAIHNMSISLSQLEAMFNAVRQRMENGDGHSYISCSFTKSEATSIFMSISTNNGISIDQHEFTTWILRGTSLSFAERKLFASESDIHMRIVNFFEIVCVLCGGADLLDGMMLASQTASAHTDMLEHGLKNLFSHFDTDNSGEIDRPELMRLMIDLPVRFYVSPDSVCVPADVDLVMKTLDSDGGGTVDFEEWKSWIVKGIKQSRSARNKYAAQSEAHRRLDLFIDTIAHISHEISAPLCTDVNELRQGLTSLFQEFDRDNDGKLAAKDLLLMVDSLSHAHSELAWFDCNDQASKELITAIGGEMENISLARWIEWMTRGSRRPALERAKFASHSKQFKQINTFLESVLIVVRKSNLLMHSSQSSVAGYVRSSGRHTSGYAGVSAKPSPASNKKITSSF